MTYTVCYMSNASLGLKKHDVEVLFDFVIDFNDSNEVSGVLVFKDGDFMQIIEGDKNVIQPLYQRIKADQRHKNIMTLYNDFLEQRLFTGYETGFSVINESIQLKKLNLYFNQVKNSNVADVNKLINLVSNFISITK